jgi:hypothetical protein
MPIYGFQTNNPSAGFAFPRSYIHQVTFGFNAGALFAQSGGDFFITDGTNPIVHVVCNFRSNFWTWNSNAYTLGYVLKDWWALTDPSPTPLPVDFSLYFSIDPVTLRRELFLFLAGWTHRYTFVLPPAPPDYWQPDT